MANFKINRKDIKKLDIIVESLTATEVYKKYKPDYFINLALYDMSKSINITYMEDENKKSGFLFAKEGLGIKGEKDLVWITTEKAYKDNEVRDYCAGSPTLVRNSQRYVDWGNKIGSHSYGRHKRSIIGFNDDSLFLVCTDDSLTIEEEVKTCLDMNMSYAINADGGGSCHLQQGSKVIKKSTRRNASWLLVYLNKDDEKPTNPTQPQKPTNKIEYVVQKGDTLSKIAQKFGVNYKDVARDNKIADPSKIRVGQRLTINK